MLKHRGFPGRLPGSDFQFVIRRANKKGATPIVRRERFRDRKVADRKADEGFMAALIQCFGEETFVRGNLDAGRLSWLIGREVVAVGKLDPTDYEQPLRIDMKKAEAAFPALFAAQPTQFNWDDIEWGDDEDWDDDEE
ncbi:MULTISPECIES: hypothetical protein [Paracoccus]|jgi:hypothetical protein|uniref:Uncharacterized protein n=1 Tax=Paracoccus litorisediminis TaxID=2006130 RepID=A0A844HH79_9RHOB|nr:MULTISPECIES: hypothetical protein [Paracoccus]MBD9525333.1 hypothetical protein [Paracoccus sp. PAR01]MTH57764.1 hypothetical protein [Paracoccus litorisediminis]